MSGFIHLRFILFIVLILASVGPVLFLGSRIKAPALQKEIDAVQEKHLLVALHMTGALDRYARDAEMAFQSAVIMAQEDIDTKALDKLLQALHFKHVCLVDADGVVRRAIVPGGAKAPQRLPTKVLQFVNEYIREEGTVFTPVMMGRNEQPLIFVAMRLAEDLLAIGAIGTEYFVETQRAIAFGIKGHAAIVDQTGRVLAHPLDDWRLAMRDLSGLDPVDRMLDGTTGVSFFYSPALNMDMVAGFSSVPRVGWGVMIPQPIVELENSAQELFSTTLKVTLVGALGAALLSWWLAGYLARPVVAVTKAASRMASGKPGPRVKLERCVPQELNTLAKAFNGMVDEISSANQRLRASERRFKDFAETAADWFWETNAELRVTYLSERFEKITGTSAQATLGKTLQEIFAASTEHPSTSHQSACQALARRTPFRKHELHWKSESDVIRVQRVSGIPIFDEHDQFLGYRGTGRDVTEAQRLSAQLSHQASHDDLTGLLNRREFEFRVNQMLTQPSTPEAEHALCFLDLDQFKVVNDTCGHVAGDELLRQIGDVIEGHTRRGDIVARLGGDEFGIVLTHCSMTEAKRVANAILEVIRDFRFVWEDKGFTVGASIGLVPIKAQATSMTEILQEADSACYLAKDNGRNRIHVYRDNDKDQAKRRGEMQWVHRINHALEEDRIQMHLQEIGAIGKSTGPGRHYELLVRMETDAGQLVDAGLFLPAAERYNLATKLDRRVIQIVFGWLCQRDGEISDQDVFAINLSGQSLGDEDFLRFLSARLEECPIHPERICFEITETAAIANLSDATRFFRELKRKGCRFALDDFGSGLSSFGYLKSLPVDYLKIDGAFVRGIVEDPVDFAMVRSINDMGHVLGKKTIAEFVESQAIYESLREIGVDYAQGYFIGKPQPVHGNLALS